MLISFCSQVKDRFIHLKETLPKNLDILSRYNNCELILLDFSSTDIPNNYIIDNFNEYIESGLLKYCKVDNQKKYHMSAVKNLSHRISNGDYIINVDIDTFISPEFMVDVINNASTYTLIRLRYVEGDIYGRIGVSRKVFDELGGYDEYFEKWGYDDDDLLFRSSYIPNLKFYLLNPKM